jgi:hypothetical protein
MQLVRLQDDGPTQLQKQLKRNTTHAKEFNVHDFIGDFLLADVCQQHSPGYPHPHR